MPDLLLGRGRHWVERQGVARPRKGGRAAGQGPSRGQRKGGEGVGDHLAGAQLKLKNKGLGVAQCKGAGVAPKREREIGSA